MRRTPKYDLWHRGKPVFDHDRLRRPKASKHWHATSCLARLFAGSCTGDLMRQTLKFLHTIGAIGMMGAMACLLVLIAFAPEPASLAEYASLRAAMGGIAKWVFLPSLMLTLIGGLLSFGFVGAYHNAGWAMAKLVSGILVFEWGFVAIQGSMQREAELSARALAGMVDAAKLGTALAAERNSLWMLLAVAAANVALGIWRPRIFPD